MKGFFDADEVRSTSIRGDGKPATCVSCGAYNYVLSPRMEAYGKGRLKMLNIGEGPGEEEDKKGKPWQGKIGRFYKRTLAEFGVELFKDMRNINAINCRPVDKKGGNRPPTDAEIECCRKRVWDEITEFDPHIIILLGGSALQSFLGHRWKKNLGGITKWAGCTIPDRETGAWVCPTFHPSYVARSVTNDNTIVETIWHRDLQNILALRDIEVPEFEDESKLVTILRGQEVNQVIKKIQRGEEGDLISFDYEATGLKPHAPGYKIISCSIATGLETCYSFMMPENLKPFIKLMRTERIRKMAHHIKFEDTLTNVIIGTFIRGWYHCSLQGTHVLDNRNGITSLKFQAYARYGLIDYSSHLTPYLETSSNDGNAINKIEQLVKEGRGDELLIYCGTDSLLEYRLALDQMEELNFTT